MKYTLLWKLKVLGLGVYRFALKEVFAFFARGNVATKRNDTMSEDVWSIPEQPSAPVMFGTYNPHPHELK